MNAQIDKVKSLYCGSLTSGNIARPRPLRDSLDYDTFERRSILVTLGKVRYRHMQQKNMTGNVLIRWSVPNSPTFRSQTYQIEIFNFRINKLTFPEQRNLINIITSTHILCVQLIR